LTSYVDPMLELVAYKEGIWPTYDKG